MIGERELDIMKPTAVFINTARGEMVDERALADALRNNKIWAAALDVFENEPHILPELLTLDNVILAPHAGTKTVGSPPQHVHRNGPKHRRFLRRYLPGIAG